MDAAADALTGGYVADLVLLGVGDSGRSDMSSSSGLGDLIMGGVGARAEEGSRERDLFFRFEDIEIDFERLCRSSGNGGIGGGGSEDEGSGGRCLWYEDDRDGGTEP